MKTAYDLKALGEKIRQKAAEEGLTLSEQAIEKLAKAAYLGLKEWAQESAVLSPNKMDDFIAPFYSQMDGYVLPQIEAAVDLDGDGK